VDRREREQILGEWGPRDGSVRERAERRVLADDLATSPLRGRPLPERPRNFRPSVEGYLASLAGPLPYMQRLRQIELETEEHERRLREAWHALGAASAGDAGRFARAWRRTAERWRFDAVNELIRRHNLYYPVEARLPMDPRSRDYVPVAGKPYRRRPLDADWILERFPPELARAAP